MYIIQESIVCFSGQLSITTFFLWRDFIHLLYYSDAVVFVAFVFVSLLKLNYVRIVLWAAEPFEAWILCRLLLLEMSFWRVTYASFQTFCDFLEMHWWFFFPFLSLEQLWVDAALTVDGVHQRTMVFHTAVYLLIWLFLFRLRLDCCFLTFVCLY